MQFIRSKPVFFMILLAAFIFRFYGIDWDQGYHLHPDERAITLYTLPLHLPQTVEEFFTPTSPLNPHFFAYGSFPLYLLKAVSFFTALLNPTTGTYNGIHLLGRFLSILFDMATLYVVYLIGKTLNGKWLGILAGGAYAASVLPIQLAHFYAVDTILTFFTTFTLYQLLQFYASPTAKRAVIIGVLFGVSLATKVSATVLIFSIGTAIALDFLLVFGKQPHKVHVWFPRIGRFLKQFFVHILLMFVFTILTFIVFEPYALIDFPTFSDHTIMQAKMTRDTFVFPYTLQYVGKTPYLYEAENIFFWGLGPLLSLVSAGGFVSLLLMLIQYKKTKVDARWIILIVFFITYFGIVGSFAIGFMRYLLPVYPLFAVFAGVMLAQLFSYHKYRLVLSFLLLGLLTWPVAFTQIYTQPNTRVTASVWITNTIPPGSVIAIEHWDDALPLFGQEKFSLVTLPLYDPDTPEKWNMMNNNLTRVDYIILASNRLYTPLQKLINCNKLPYGRCYEKTAQYYKKLFSNQLGFYKAAEFAVYPTIPLLNIPIDDQKADESFTVYDHPKILLYKRVSR